jgi:hypothetical protein
VTGIASAQTTVKVATQDELASAVSSAAAGSTISISAAGSYTMPNLPQNITIEGTVDGVEFNHTGSGNVANVPKGATFKNVAFNFGNENYHGFQAAGTINMEGCTINGKLFSYGDMNFTNCQFVQNNSDYHMWCYSGNVTYTGCMFTNNKTGKFLNIYNEGLSTKYTVTVNNCKFVNNAAAAKAALNVKATCGSKLLAYDVIINGCTTEGAFPAAGDNCVDGGKITGIVVKPLVQVDDRTADGKDNITVTQDGKKIYPVSYVAQIGENKYKTLAEAVAAAKSGDTIKLLADLENTGNVSLPAGVTLDGDGKNITGTSAVYINKDGGTVQKVNFKHIHNSSNKQSAIYGNGLVGTATITGCTFDNCDWDAIQITPVAGANVVITNNMFSDDVTDNVKQQRYIHVQSKTNVDFSATITENVMPGKLTQEPIGVYYPTDKAKIDLTKNYIESINDVCILVADNNGYAGELVFPAYTTAEKQETYSPVAMIQNGNYAANFYTTLQAAVDAAEAGTTIEILKDFTLTTVTTSPSDKYNVNVNKSVTINGNGHVLTSAEGKRALVLQGAGNNVVLKDITVKSNKAEACLWIADAVNVTLDNSTLDGTNGKTYNQPLTIGKFDSESRVALNVINGSVIKTNDAGTAHYDIIASHPADITVTNSKLIGWANVYLKPGAAGSMVKIDGSEMKSQGLSGSSNNFAIIVTEGGNNTIEVKDTKIEGAAVEGTYQSLFRLGGKDNVLKFLGNTTYETNDMTWGCATYEPGSAEINKIYFDETTKAAFAKYFAEEGGARISETTDEAGLYPLNYVSEVYYYWVVDGVEDGGNYDLAQPFVNGWLDDGEFIRLKKDVALASNLTWAKENASFTMTFGDYKVTKGEYSIALKQRVTVNTDKQTDIFTAVDADYKVVETAVEGGYTYTVVTKEYVAQIGEGESATRYESLEAAFAAAADGNTVTLLKDVSLTDRLFVNAGAEPAYAGSNNRYATTSENKSITLDLSGYNVTSSSNIALAGGGLNIVNSGTADADHGVISTTNAGLAPIEIRGTGDLTQKRTLTVGTGVTLSGAVYGLNIFGSNNEQKNVIDVNVNGTVNGTLFVLGNLKNAENEININVAGTVYVPGNDNNDANVGIALNGIATVNVNEGAQVSGETGIEVRAGNLIVNGGNITATASTYSEKKNASGSCTEGAAVAVAQHTTKLPITATLNGGTLTGTKTLVVTDVEEIGLNDVTVKAADALANAETVIIPAAYKWVSADGMSTLTKKEYVAQVGDVKYETLKEALDAAKDNENIVVELLADATLDITAWSGTKNPLAIGTESTKSITINGNSHTLTFNQKNSDWNNIATMNDDVTKLVLNNMAITNSGYDNGTWNSHDINFNCAVELNNVTSDKALAFKNDASLKNVTVTETGDVYAILVQPHGQNISIDGLTINAANGRGIKIDDQYVDNPEQVTLDIANATFNTKKKSAILVKSAANTVITAGEGINIKNVASDKENLVWVDEDRAEEFYKVTVEGATIVPESKVSDYVACVMNGEQSWGFYKKLSDAVINVEEGYSIKLHQTTAEAVEVSKALTITKNGFTADNVTAGEGFKKFETETEIVIKAFNPVCAIGDEKYESLQEAVNAAGTNAATITLLTDAATDGVITGNGVKVQAGQNITFDLKGLTYNVDKTVGSAGTETNGFQLLKGSTVKFTNGTLTSATAQILLQNYSDLTLDGVTVNAGSADYAVSNNFGSLTVTGETNINAKSGGCAFDLWYGMYRVYDDGISIVFDENFTGSVTGKVEYGHHSSATNEDWRDKTKLEIKAGKFDIEFANGSAGALDGANIKISGGVFAEKPADEYCAEGYIVTDNTDEATKAQYPNAVKTKEEAGIYELIDGEPYKYVGGVPNVKKVTYKRTFKKSAGHYQCWFVPFDYTIGENTPTGVEFFKINQFSAARNESTGEADSEKDIWMHIVKVEEGILRANKPYLVRVPEDGPGEYQFIAENVPLEAEKNNESSILYLNSSYYDFNFYGIYGKGVAPSINKNEWLSMSTIGMLFWNKEEQKLNSYRWYIRPSVRKDDGSYAKPNIVVVEGEGDTDGISNVQMIDGEIEGIYTLGGIKVEHPIKGVNIIKYTDGRTKKINVK